MVTLRPAVLLLAISIVMLPGCIVGEIRDELKLANQQLTTVQESLGKLDTTNQSLAATNNELDQTNKLINSVQGGLGRIDKTNDSLSTLEQQLILLNSIEKSLTRLDNHLAGLRGTINKLDGVIPFLDLGAGDIPPPVPVAAQTNVNPSGTQPTASEAAVPAVTQEAQAATETPTVTTTSVQRDSMTGTWVTTHPNRGGVVVLLADGKYLFAYALNPAVSAQNATIERGTWKRIDRGTIEFSVPDGDSTYVILQTGNAQINATQTPNANSSASTNTSGSEPSITTPRTWKMTVISQGPRSATTEIGNAIYVWTRP